MPPRAEVLVAAAAATAGLAYVVRRMLLRQSAPRPPPNRKLVEKIDTLVFDCDGVIYRHSSAVPGVPETLAKLRAAGKRLLFVTNAAAASRKSLASKLAKLGVAGVSESDCVTSASAAAAYLATHHPSVRRAYVVGQGGLLDELREHGIEPIGESDVGGLEALLASGGLEASLPIDAVVVGMQYEQLCYSRLAKAAAYARDTSRVFVGTNPDSSWPAGATELLPAGGCNVAYVSYAAERQPDVVVGKPSRDLARLVAEMNHLTPEATLMVGDRLNTDVAFGKSVGWRTMLVLTGCHGLADVASAGAHEMPDFVAASVADLASLL
jgi:4-nitrophenyl phosphatase